jgi:hypothetical protein
LPDGSPFGQALKKRPPVPLQIALHNCQATMYKDHQ